MVKYAVIIYFFGLANCFLTIKEQFVILQHFPRSQNLDT